MKKAVLLFILSLLLTSLQAQVVVNVTGTFATCFGLCDGSATANAFGGTPPYTYLWSDGQTTQTAINLCADTYGVTVTDYLGNTGSQINFGVGSPDPITFNVFTTNDCAGACNGSAYAVVSGGTWPYTYVWSVPSGGPFVDNLCSGNYYVTVSDANGCNETQMAVINYIPNPVTSFTVDTDPAFCHASTGQATIASVTGGDTPYTYLWSTGATTQTTTGLPTGVYAVTVSDANGCSVSNPVVILDSLGFQILLDSISPTNCANNQLGYIGISTSGGTGPFTFNWDPGGMTTAAINNLVAGNYFVTVTDDATGCSLQSNYTVTSTYNLYASVNSTPSRCNNDDGTATAMAFGANPPFSFQWSDPLAQTDTVADSLAPGLYFVTITDAIGCYIIASTTVSHINLFTVNGYVYEDLNLNCHWDAGDAGISGVVVAMNPGGYTITDSTGFYDLPYISNPSMISLSGYANYYNIICPVSGTHFINYINPSACDSTGQVNFSLTQQAGIFDLSVHPGSGTARPGFYLQYSSSCGFFITGTTNATVTLAYDPVLDYANSTLGGVNDPIAHTVTWNFNNILPTGSTTYLVFHPSATFWVPSNTPLGDTLHSTFEIQPVTGDFNPVNNSVTISDIVTGSYDPNDISVNPIGLGPNSCILPSDSVLHYQIRFQNTGTDTAFTVIVVDTLSPYVNPATFEMGGSSHPCNVSMQGDGILTFRFNQILLPDSNVNQTGSNGYFTYSVHTDPGLAWNTVIENRAAIYFDFNAPVITNTVVNTLCEPVIVPIVNNLNVSVYPNPASGHISFSVSEENWHLRIFDVCGKEVLNRVVNGINTSDIKLPEHVRGVYLYEINANNRTVFGKFVAE